jgi:inorganic pyrophosphatase
LKIDRPQKFSNVVPSLYGFIPQTYCDIKIAEFAAIKSGKIVTKGDGDPLDICVLSEKTITHGDILLQAIPIGGLRLIDKGEADDKIIAVMKGDEVFEEWKDISDCTHAVIDRLKHYFLTYKNLPGAENPTCEITQVYGREEAYEVIKRSMEDYKNKFLTK